MEKWIQNYGQKKNPIKNLNSGSGLTGIRMSKIYSGSSNKYWNWVWENPVSGSGS